MRVKRVQTVPAGVRALQVLKSRNQAGSLTAFTFIGKPGKDPVFPAFLVDFARDRWVKVFDFFELVKMPRVGLTVLALQAQVVDCD